MMMASLTAAAPLQPLCGRSRSSWAATSPACQGLPFTQPSTQPIRRRPAAGPARWGCPGRAFRSALLEFAPAYASSPDAMHILTTYIQPVAYLATHTPAAACFCAPLHTIHAASIAPIAHACSPERPPSLSRILEGGQSLQTGPAQSVPMQAPSDAVSTPLLLFFLLLSATNPAAVCSSLCPPILAGG